MNLSRDLTEKFKDKERQNGPSSDGEFLVQRRLRVVIDTLAVDFTVMVLGSNNWPIVPQPTDYAVPREIQGTYDRLSKFHSDVHSWVPCPDPHLARMES